MRVIIQSYSFDASEKKITFNEFLEDGILLRRVLLVLNASTGDILYNIGDPELAGVGNSVNSNVLTLAYDTTSMNDTDDLFIAYEDPDAALEVSLATKISDIIDSIIANPKGIPYVSLTASGIVSGIPSKLNSIFVSSMDTATIKFWDNTAASGTVLIDTFTPVLGWNFLGNFVSAIGVYATVTGTINAKVGVLPA